MEWSATAGGGWNIKPCPDGARGKDVNQFVFERLLVIYILQVELNFDPLPIEPPVAQWLAPPNKTSEGRLREVENAPLLHP